MSYKCFISIIFGIFTLVTRVSYSQSSILEYAQIGEEWTILEEQNGIQFFVKIDECDLNENQLPFVYSFLKIVNTTSEEKHVTYNYAHYFEEGCDGCDAKGERTFSFDMEANSTIEANCDSEFVGLSGFINNPNFDGGWHFEGIQLLYVTVD